MLVCIVANKETALTSISFHAFVAFATCYGVSPECLPRCELMQEKMSKIHNHVNKTERERW